MEKILFVLIAIFCILLFVFEMYTMVKSYQKAGIAGWKALIPIWNILALFRLANLSNWMLVLFFIPGVNIYITYLVFAALADRLGKARSFAIGLLLFPFIFFPILAFSKQRESFIPTEDESLEKEEMLMHGPIAPLGAMPDLDEIYEEGKQEVETEFQVPMQESVIGPLEQNLTDSYMVNDSTKGTSSAEMMENTIAPVVTLDVGSPMHAMEKVQYVEEKKEDVLDMDTYRECPNCGTKLGMDASVCFLCGKRLDEE